MDKCIGEFFYRIGAREVGLDKNLTVAGQKFERFGKKAMVASAGIAAFYALAINKSMEFNKSMGNVATLVDGQIKSMDEYKKSVQEVGIQTGTTTDIMADGLYQVVSAYGESADTIKQLELNAKAAKAGVSSVTDAVNLTSAVTKAYGDTSSVAQQRVSDLAFTAVKLGQTTFPELAASVQVVTSTAEKMNVSQEELFGVMATLTGVTGNASMVTTQLRSALVSMDAPTESMIELYKKLGVESGKELIQQQGLQGAFMAITKEVQLTGKPMKDFIGRVEGQNAILALAGKQADVYRDKLKQVKDANGATEEAFRKQTEGINKTGFAYEQTKIKLTVLTQEMGDKLLPAFNEALDVISKGVEGFENLSDSVQNVILALGGFVIIGGPTVLMIGKVMKAVVALRLALAGPVGLVIAGGIAAGTLAAMAVGFSDAADEANRNERAVKKLIDQYKNLDVSNMYLSAIVQQQNKVLSMQGEINEATENGASKTYTNMLQRRLEKENSILTTLTQQNTERLNAEARAKRRIGIAQEEAAAEKRIADEIKATAAADEQRQAEKEQQLIETEAAEQTALTATLDRLEQERLATIQNYEEFKALKEQELIEEQARAAIRIQILGTEEDKKADYYEKEKERMIAMGISTAEAQMLIEKMVTKDYIDELKKRILAYMAATNQVLGMASGFVGQMISINNQETQNKINNLNEAAMSEEDYQRAKAYFNYKGSVEAWKLQVMQAKLQIPTAMINAFTSAAAIPLIGWIIAPVMAAVAGVFAMKQYQAVAAARPPVPQLAEGGSFTVPERPEYRRDGFPLQVEAGEQVDVTPADQVGKGSSGAVYLDGHLVGKYFGDLSRNGKLKISSRSIV